MCYNIHKCTRHILCIIYMKEKKERYRLQLTKLFNFNSGTRDTNNKDSSRRCCYISDFDFTTIMQQHLMTVHKNIVKIVPAIKIIISTTQQILIRLIVLLLFVGIAASVKKFPEITR